MERRKFIKSIALGVGGISLAAHPIFNTGQIQFGISTDIHKDIMHDADQRLTKYLSEAEKQGLDFIIDLGDFCLPQEKNKGFLNIWNSTSLQKYNVLGNHDMDTGTKQDFMDFVGMEKRYYSFDKGDFHFIVLDPNNLFVDGEYIPYAKANFYRPAEQRAFMDPAQLEWLKKDLQQTNKCCVVFSHQSFETPTACKNQELVREIFEETNKKAGFQKVVAAFSGHHHTDYAVEINAIHYVQVNSMSNQWLGDKYACEERFSKEINKKYPNLKKTAPYKDPLFAIVKIQNGVLEIKGVQSSFIQPGPKELGVDLAGKKYPTVAKISDRKLNY